MSYSFSSGFLAINIQKSEVEHLHKLKFERVPKLACALQTATAWRQGRFWLLMQAALSLCVDLLVFLKVT